MGTLINASVLIAAGRGELDLDALLESHGDESSAVSAITASELRHGVHRLKTGVGRARAQSLVDDTLAMMPIVPFDLSAARVHAILSAELASKGTAVGAHTLIIAATAVAMSFSVATRNRRSFPIKGLALLVR